MVALTEAGLDLIDRAFEAHMANEHRLVGTLGERDRAELARLLERWGRALGHDGRGTRRRGPGTGDAFLDLLYGEAPLTEFDGVITRASAAGASEDRLAELRRQHAVAVRLRELIARQRVREAELTALYETARDLTAIRELDTILAAIVRRARQLLNADMTYLSLNDEAEGASYMKVTDGALTQEFRSLRLPLGTGLLGLVAQTGAPYFTEDYQADERFVHRGYIDEAVAGEHPAILGCRWSSTAA